MSINYKSRHIEEITKVIDSLPKPYPKLKHLQRNKEFQQQQVLIWITIQKLVVYVVESAILSKK